MFYALLIIQFYLMDNKLQNVVLGVSSGSIGGPYAASVCQGGTLPYIMDNFIDVTFQAV